MTLPARFRVRAASDPQTLPRLVNYLAQLGLVPSKVQARESEGQMTVSIEQPVLQDREAGIIAAKMRSSVLVNEVVITRGRRIIDPQDENKS